MASNALPEKYFFGYDRECADKMRKKIDTKFEQEVRDWIEAVSGTKMGDTSTFEMLRDGTVLCDMLNKIMPGSIKKIHRTSKLPYMQMENIDMFLSGIAALGTPSTDLFKTVDLYEEKDMFQVLLTIQALERVCTRKGISVPALGPRESQPNRRDFDEEVLQRGRAIPSQQMGTNEVASQSGSRAPGSRREIVTVTTGRP